MSALKRAKEHYVHREIGLPSREIPPATESVIDALHMRLSEEGQKKLAGNLDYLLRQTTDPLHWQLINDHVTATPRERHAQFITELRAHLRGEDSQHVGAAVQAAFIRSRASSGSSKVAAFVTKLAKGTMQRVRNLNPRKT